MSTDGTGKGLAEDATLQAILAAMGMSTPQGGTGAGLAQDATLQAILAATGSKIGTQYAFVYRPGGVAGANVYTSWTALYAVLSVVSGPKTVWIDDSIVSPVVIPAGSYALDGVSFECVADINSTTGGAILQFASGAQVFCSTITFGDFLQVTTPSASSVMTVTGGKVTVTIGSSCLIESTSAPFFHVTSGGFLQMVVGNGSGLGDGTHAAITMDATAQGLIRTNFASLNGGFVTGAGANNLVVEADGGSALASPVNYVAAGGGLAPNPMIMLLGDSNTAGLGGSSAQGGYPMWLVQALRAWRSNFELVASQILLPAPPMPGSSVLWNEGHGGFTIANINAAFPGYVTAIGSPPNIVVVMLGTNDIATGRTLVQMQADFATLFATIKAQGCGLVMIMGPPPMLPPRTAAEQALQASFTSWLANTFVVQNAVVGAVYSNASQLPGPGCYYIDGIHLNQEGGATVGAALAAQLDTAYLPKRAGDTLPRRFMKEPLAGALQVTTAATDNASITGHTGIVPGAGSFAVAFDFYPTSIGAGGFTLLTYGVNGTPPYYTIVRNGAKLGVIIDLVAVIAQGTSPVSEIFGDVPGLQVNQWHRVFVNFDATHQEISMYLNAQAAGMATSSLVPTWNLTQQTLYVGQEPVSAAGAVGYYSRVQVFKGLVGRGGSLALLQSVERDYYQHQSLGAALGAAFYTFDGSLADLVYSPGAPNPNAVLGGGAASLSANTAVPGTIPARPWEYAGGFGLGPGV